MTRVLPSCFGGCAPVGELRREGHVPVLRSDSSMCQAQRGAERRVGRLAVAGRYHYLPRRLEDDYDVSKVVLGTGASGDVLAGTCRRSGMAVAIKKLLLRGAFRDEKQHFSEEVETFLSLDHPHVGRLFGIYEASGVVRIVMERLSGGELYDRLIQKQVFTEAEAADASRQMLLAINYLHHEKVVHRDLKLQNFLYDEEGSDYLKLIDFGFSRFCNRGEKMADKVGTPTYVAPEVLDRQYSQGSCDMWSFGCIVFALVFGHMPFPNCDKEERERRIRAADYRVREEAWQNLSAVGQDFLRKLFVVDPRSRLTAQQALAHPFVAAQVQETGPQIHAPAVNGFLSLARADEFQRSCLRLMAWSLTLEDRRSLRNLWTSMESSGVVALKDLERWVREDVQCPSAQVAAVIKALTSLDHDGDGELHYSDFLAGMMAQKLEQHDVREELLRAAFRGFDVEGTGFLTPSALEWFVGKKHGIAKAFSKVHLAQSGRMSEEEFVDGWHVHGRT